MAFPVEDQTDENFFDKLVDDDFAVSDSDKITRNLSSLSLTGDGELVSEAEEKSSNEIGVDKSAPGMELVLGEEETSTVAKDLFVDGKLEVEENKNNDVSLSQSAPGSEFVSAEVPLATAVGDLNGKGSGLPGTSVKEVQWSAFDFDNQQQDTCGFDSYSDFLAEGFGGSISQLQDSADLGSSFCEQPSLDSSTYLGSSEQQLDSRTQIYASTVSEQSTDFNDPKYWENLYPGWKYDYTTGQWCQIDGYDMSANLKTDNYSMGQEAKTEEQSQDGDLAAGKGTVAESSSLSYLQQTTNSFLETVPEERAASVTSSWNQDSNGSVQYPANMVFDPQYPEWYYDTITQQWYTLESYTQSLSQTATDTSQDQLSQNVRASGGFARQQSYAFGEVGQSEGLTAQSLGNQDWNMTMSSFSQGDWGTSTSSYASNSMQQLESFNMGNHVEGLPASPQSGRFYGSWGRGSYIDQHSGFKPSEPVLSNGHASSTAMAGLPGFALQETSYQYRHQVEPRLQAHSAATRSFEQQSTVNYPQPMYHSGQAPFAQSSYAPSEGRSSAGRPPHALVTFGFGGKLIVMEESTTASAKIGYGSQSLGNGTISILNLMEVVADRADELRIATDSSCNYFQALCQQSFPGPLVGGNAATKDVNKWVDERILSCETSAADFHRGPLLKLLLSLLKIACLHYGKLRSPFGVVPPQEEIEGPEVAVATLFASAKKNGGQLGDFGLVTYGMKNFPSEEQIRGTAVEVQNLLISGKRKEAFQLAQEGYLWGPALVLAAQLGDKFYAEAVKTMAHRQFISGSPLRTLCLLIAGQPADVFSTDSSSNNFPAAASAYQHTAQTPSNGMLDGWEENLAIITANRTKNDELVITHLGDCLWRERGEVTAAHTCYLVAEKTFESYTETARLCLIGADHLKRPRTYACPEAIQRTELYEYAKVLGNSQFLPLPFQPYKFVYASMLAEVGKVSDSLRYCQASLKLLRNSSRAPEVEMWKSLFSSLEERLRTHQQGGYSSNLAPAKLVGKIFTSFDRSIQRMIGAPPPALPPLPNTNGDGKESYPFGSEAANSQPTRPLSSLMPSASVEAISDWTGDGSKRTMHNRSISEPDFGRSPQQADAKNSRSPDLQQKASGVPSRFGLFGSQLLQKTVGWVSRSRPDQQAKLGEANKFYYDEKLKRWVEEGTEPPSEEPSLPPPPMTATFQNATPTYNINNAFKSPSSNSNGGSEEQNSGTPPIPPSTNQFSARARKGVRSRYVDTFNKGDTGLMKSFQSPSVTSVKPAVPATFFVPAAPAACDEQSNNEEQEAIHDVSTHGDQSTSLTTEASFVSTSTSSSLLPPMQQFPSIDHTVTPDKKKTEEISQPPNGTIHSHTRAVSWGGVQFDASKNKINEPLPFVPGETLQLRSSSSLQQLHGGSLGDDLHEVEL